MNGKRKSKQLLSGLLVMLCIVTGVYGKDFESYAVIIDASQALNEDRRGRGKDIFPLKGHFGQAYNVLEEDREYLQLEINNHRGWLSKDAVLFKPPGGAVSIYARQNQIVLPKPNGADIRLSTTLTKKIIVVNQLKSKSHPIDIPIYDNPALSDPPISHTTIFELLYLFNEHPDAVLVGGKDRLLKITAHIVLNGWIATKHIYEWNNRLGVEFDKNTYTERVSGLGEIFEAEDEVLHYMKQGTADRSIYKEEKTASPMPYYVNRFPVLNDNWVRERKHYRIVYIGGGYRAGDKQYTAQQIADEKRKIGGVIQNKRVKIAVLVDATKGMQRHIASVKNALQRFVQDIKKDDNIRVEIAVAIYRDYSDGEDMFRIKTKGFTNDYEAVKSVITSIQAYSHPDDIRVGAYPEALFYGMDHTIKAFNRKKEQVDNYMILIGDHGNHEDYSQYPQDEKYTVAGIKKKLESGNIKLYAVQVNLTRKKRKYNEMFEKQIRGIVGVQNPLADLQIVRQNTTEAVYQAFVRIYKTFYWVKAVLAGASQGSGGLNRLPGPFRPSASQNPAKVLASPGYMGRFTEMVLKRYHINPDIFNAVQACAIGYVAQKNQNGVKQIEEKVLMSKRDVERLKVQVSELAEAVYFAGTDTREETKNTILSVIKELTGDKPRRNETISKFIRKRAGIPVQTRMLEFSVKELIDRIRDSRPKAVELAKYLRKKEILLEQVIGEEIYKIDAWREEDGTYDYDAAGEKREYLFSLEQPLVERLEDAKLGKILKTSQKTHVWLPLEYLP